MKYTYLLLLTLAFYSCSNNEPFINHTLAYEKTGECTAGEKTINMTSNIAGERYEFESCLNTDFAGKAYTVERKGDSLVVAFQRHDGEKAAFKITLDIDAFPVYDHIVIDGHEAIAIQHVEK